MRSTLPLTFAGALLCSASLVSAQVTNIGPFTGDESEGFETQAGAGQSGFTPCLIGRAFNNNADLCTPGASGTHITGGWSFRCQIGAHSGTWFTGSAGGHYEYTFDTDITQFGGYFGTNAWLPGSSDFVTVNFYDRMGGQIDSVVADVADDCTWRWNGWSSTTGIARIEVINSVFGGAFVDMDDLEITFGGGAVGTPYCQAATNSTGQPGALNGSGSTSVAANNLTLDATQLPPMAFGYFLGSQTMGNTPNPGGSQGTLCLGGSIGRFVGPGQIQNAGTSGSFSLQVDSSALPLPVGTAAASPGDTWFFQCWYRDQNPGVTSNLTNGLEVVFTM